MTLKINQKIKKIYKKRILKKTKTRLFFVPFKKEGSLVFNNNFISGFNKSVIKYFKKLDIFKDNFKLLSFCKNNKIIIIKEQLFVFSFLFYFIKRNNFFKIKGKQKQYFYLIFNLICVLFNNIFNLNRNEIFLSKLLVMKKKNIFFLMQKVSLNQIEFFFKLKYFSFSIVWFKYLKFFYNV